MYYCTTPVLNSRVLLMYTDTVKELPGYPVQNSPSGSFLLWGGALGSKGVVYDIVWRRCARRTPWMMLRTSVCSYPIIVTHLSFNFLCLLPLLYSIYLNGLPILFWDILLWAAMKKFALARFVLSCILQIWKLSDSMNIEITCDWAINGQNE